MTKSHGEGAMAFIINTINVMLMTNIVALRTRHAAGYSIATAYIAQP
jgi:hypothetical protein